jgi:hypothetical protein
MSKFTQNLVKPKVNYDAFWCRDVEVLETPCGNGVWHIERCPPTSHVDCFALQKSTKHSSIVRIIANLTSIGALSNLLKVAILIP